MKNLIKNKAKLVQLRKDERRAKIAAKKTVAKKIAARKSAAKKR